MSKLLSLWAMVLLSACGSSDVSEHNTSTALQGAAATTAEPDYVNIEAAEVQPLLDECYARGGKSVHECNERIEAGEFNNTPKISEPEFSAPFPGKYGTTNGMWAFGKVVDRMRNETISEAYTISKTSDQNELLIRLQRKEGVTFKATLELHKRTGFAICGYDCAIAISVDGKMRELVARNHNPGATELEVFDASGFERLLKNSSKLFIELELDDGLKQYEFRTQGLDWSAADAAEPMFSS